MVKIRLRRTGSKKRPSYRMVVAPSTAPRDGRFIEVVGHYNPRHDPPTVVVKEDRLFHWLSVGAQLTDSLKRILQSNGTLDRYANFKAGQPLDAGAPQAEAETEPEAAVDAEPEAAAEAEAEPEAATEVEAEAETEPEAATEVEAEAETEPEAAAEVEAEAAAEAEAKTETEAETA